MTEQAQEHRSQVPSAAVCAEAAAWMARLHGEQRTAAVEEGFRRWLAASEEHRAAFDLANDIWTGADKWPRPATPTIVRWPRVGIVLTLPRAIAAAAMIAVLVLFGAKLYLNDSGLATRVGEQRTITLEDGTRVSLNTATRIKVDYDKDARRVRLVEGEGLFEVASRPQWPFIVTVGDRNVLALGTSFVVRLGNERDIAVTLLEGKVAVSSVSVPQPASLEAGTDTVFLQAGDRLTFASGAEPSIDRPTVEQVTAWQRGQVIFDHTPLDVAIDEMNRYSQTQLSIDDAAASLEVTGVFRAGDILSFAGAVGATYDLELVEESRGIRLVAATAPSARP